MRSSVTSRHTLHCDCPLLPLLGRAIVALTLPSVPLPAGKLFSAMHSADAERVIQYLFPLERLPAHTQELLKRPAGRKELSAWPQYAGRLQVGAASWHVLRRCVPYLVHAAEAGCWLHTGCCHVARVTVPRCCCP